MFIIAYDVLPTLMQLIFITFASEDTDQSPWYMVHVTHTAFFISSIPLVGLPSGCHTYFLGGTLPKDPRTETYLRTTS